MIEVEGCSDLAERELPGAQLSTVEILTNSIVIIQIPFVLDSALL